jgi:carboxylesterase type B
LLEDGKVNGSDGIVYVSINSRLGALGFLGSLTFKEDGTANVGFNDQRLALQWIQDNIHLFGGDKNQVTVGESGGVVRSCIK